MLYQDTSLFLLPQSPDSADEQNWCSPRPKRCKTELQKSLPTWQRGGKFTSPIQVTEHFCFTSQSAFPVRPDDFVIALVSKETVYAPDNLGELGT